MAGLTMSKYTIFFLALIAARCCFGQTGTVVPGHPKGRCPLKDGIMRPLATRTGIIVGTEKSTVDIWGSDSVVVSATAGRVMDVIREDYTMFIIIRSDTTNYTYIDLDRSLVKEGQLVQAGQVIAIAKEKRISFYVSNFLNRIFRNPDAYVDCVCELPKTAEQ